MVRIFFYNISNNILDENIKMKSLKLHINVKLLGQVFKNEYVSIELINPPIDFGKPNSSVLG